MCYGKPTNYGEIFKKKSIFYSYSSPLVSARLETNSNDKNTF